MLESQWAKTCETTTSMEKHHTSVPLDVLDGDDDDDDDETAIQGSFTCSIFLVGTSDQRLGACAEFVSFLCNFPRRLQAMIFPQHVVCSLGVKNETHPESHNFQQINKSVLFYC